MRTGAYLVMRYGPLIGRAPDSPRRISVLTRARTAREALEYATGWRHWLGSLWIAKQGEPATRKRRPMIANAGRA